MDYVDVFLAPVLSDSKEQYIEYAAIMSQVFKDYGATHVVECWGDDIPAGELTSFPLAVKCKENESVVCSWITWPSKAVRDAGLEKAFADPRMDEEKSPLPFDGKRMIFGGFQKILDV